MTLNQNPEGMLSQKLAESVYTPESQLRNPKELFRNMWNDLLASRELAWRLLVRNISAKYRQTALGYLWAFLPAIFTTVTFVFLNNQKIISVENTKVPYPVFVLINMLSWQVFVDAINSPIKIINESKSFLAKIYFPREALILAGLGEVFFNFTIRLLLLLVVFFCYGLSVQFTTFLFPAGIFALAALGSMFGILISPIGVLYSDIEKGLPILTSIWFFLTPVIYPQPTSWPASLLVSLNPVTSLLVTTRETITIGEFTQVTPAIIVFTMTILLFFLAWVLYRVALPHLIERMSA